MPSTKHENTNKIHTGVNQKTLRIRAYFLSKPALLSNARECADKIELEMQGRRFPNLRMLTYIGFRCRVARCQILQKLAFGDVAEFKQGNQQQTQRPDQLTSNAFGCVVRPFRNASKKRMSLQTEHPALADTGDQFGGSEMTPRSRLTTNA